MKRNKRQERNVKHIISMCIYEHTLQRLISRGGRVHGWSLGTRFLTTSIFFNISIANCCPLES